MRRPLAATAFLAFLAFPAQANEGVDLSTKSRAQASQASKATALTQAPFTAARDPLPEILYNEEQARRGPSGNCEAASTDLCYDLAEGRIVYRPVRQYMPKVDGLTPESVSLRRNRIVFKYSF